MSIWEEKLETIKDNISQKRTKKCVSQFDLAMLRMEEELLEVMQEMQNYFENELEEIEGRQKMSYDIHLKDPVTGDIAVVPGHLMTGGTYKAEYHPETNTFTPALNTEAELNITYNYSSYYYESCKECEKEGIRTIYGMTGQESISLLEKMISGILEKYKADGEWITTTREESMCINPETGKEIKDIVYAIRNKVPYETIKIKVKRKEGPNTNYWKPTAGNALKPLYQLLALARMRPDCIWDGD